MKKSRIITAKVNPGANGLIISSIYPCNGRSCAYTEPESSYKFAVRRAEDRLVESTKNIHFPDSIIDAINNEKKTPSPYEVIDDLAHDQIASGATNVTINMPDGSIYVYTNEDTPGEEDEE